MRYHNIINIRKITVTFVFLMDPSIFSFDNEMLKISMLYEVPF